MENLKAFRNMLMGRALISNLRKMTTNLKSMMGPIKRKGDHALCVGKLGVIQPKLSLEKGILFTLNP